MSRATLAAVEMSSAVMADIATRGFGLSSRSSASSWSAMSMAVSEGELTLEADPPPEFDECDNPTKGHSIPCVPRFCLRLLSLVWRELDRTPLLRCPSFVALEAGEPSSGRLREANSLHIGLFKAVNSDADGWTEAFGPEFPAASRSKPVAALVVDDSKAAAAAAIAVVSPFVACDKASHRSYSTGCAFS